MNIVVCIKQVPDTTDIKIDEETNTLIRQGIECIINPYDMHAIETGLRLRDEYDGKVTVLSMGPPQVKEALKDTIALGVDDVVLLSDRDFAGADTWATSYTLAQGIKAIGDIDLVLCGKQAIDGDTGQVGPGIAEQMQIPHTTYIKEIMEVNDDYIVVKRKIETGYEKIKMQLPALLTVTKELNEVRLPSIRGLLRSKDIDVSVWTSDDLELDENGIGLDGSPTQVVSVSTPEYDQEGEIYTGDIEKQTDNLLEALSGTENLLKGE